MKRRHREIGSGEVAMMAVITKAMGAFLVLMILLLPYYTGDTKSQETVDETKQRIDQAKAGLDGAVDKLKKGRLTDAEIDDLLKSLMLARDELVEAQNLISQLRIKIDQMASQINRLDQQNAALQTEVAKLQSEMDALKSAVAALVAENLALKASVADLTAKLSALETANAALTAENTALKASIAELNSKVTTLETENASLTQENAALKAEIERLKAFDPETLKARIKELEKQLEDMTAKLTALEDANATLKKQNMALSAENADLRQRQFNPTLYVTSDCGGDPNLVVGVVVSQGPRSDEEYDDTYVATLMPWVTPSFRPYVDNAAKSEGAKISIEMQPINLNQRDSTWDIFLKIDFDDTLAKKYAEEAIASGTMSDGSIISSQNLAICKATIFIYLKAGTIEFGTYQLGLVEPLIHVKHVIFHSDGKLDFAKDQRPELPRHIANAVCTRFSLICALAKRHAEWRVRGQDPWVRENIDPADTPIIPPSPAADDKTPPPQNSNAGPPPPPNADKTISPSP